MTDLNIDKNIKLLILKAEQKYRFVSDQAAALGISLPTLKKYKRKLK